MKIKKYQVRSIDEALSLIKRDLGGDAFILSQKKVTQRGAVGLAPVEMLEVTAAVEAAPGPRAGGISSTLLAKKYPGVPQTGGDERPAPTVAKPALDLTGIRDEIQPLRQEIDDLRSMLRRIGRDRDGDGEEFRGLFAEAYGELVDQGVEPTLARRLTQTLQVSTASSDLADREQLNKNLFHILLASVAGPAPIKTLPGARRVVAFVGPTGAGKTTTLAKLASYFRLILGKKVALITLDSFRIGAEAHLHTYARLLNVPCHTVYTREDLEYRLSRLTDMDLVFVDTTGRGARDREGIDGVAALVNAIPRAEREVHLVIPATLKEQDAAAVLKAFAPACPDKLIFSKLDETFSYGGIFTLKARSDLPASYFTTGQRVPEDIEVAGAGRFARLVLSEHKQGDAA